MRKLCLACTVSLPCTFADAALGGSLRAAGGIAQLYAREEALRKAEGTQVQGDPIPGRRPAANSPQRPARGRTLGPLRKQRRGTIAPLVGHRRDYILSAPAISVFARQAVFPTVPQGPLLSLSVCETFA